VDVIGSHHVIEHSQAKTLLCLRASDTRAIDLWQISREIFSYVNDGLCATPVKEYNVDSLAPFLKACYCRQKGGSKRQNQP
jgi:hypothetical protein